MCEYCGCQEIEQIAELTAEHDLLRALSRDLLRACETADPAAARQLAERILDVLGPHTRVEEGGLFPQLAAEFGEHLAALEDEHARIHATLSGLLAPNPAQRWSEDTITALHLLFEHILKEQDGVFPAALGSLGPAGWAAVTAARADADREGRTVRVGG